MTGFPWITALTLTPLVGGLMIVGLEKDRNRLARGLAFLFSVVGLVLAILIWRRFDPTSSELQFVERHSWIPTIGVEYLVGLDGLGLLMVLLSTILVPMAILASGDSASRTPLYYSLILWLESGLIGAFTALNFFHWFIFWELSLVPAFFLIRFWGGPERTAAATQFFVYTLVGSIALLLSFLAMYLSVGSFDFNRLGELGQSGELASAFVVKLGWYSLSKEQLAGVIFFGAFLGFAVKVPIMPFHTWLPQTYAEAPSPVTMLLTGAMSKMGVYGFLRILLPIFPEQMRQILTPLLWLVVITIVFSAAAAFAQRDLKRMLAYSSINHLGYCLLGIFAAVAYTGTDARMAAEKSAALNGTLLQMFNHGLTAATLFCLVGFIERRSDGKRGLNDFGGLRRVAPVFCGLMGIALFSSLGLPGLNGFIGEFLIFKGAFSLAAWATALSTLGLLITAVLILTILQRVWSGPLNRQWTAFADLTWGELLIVVPSIVLMFVLGIYPQWLIAAFNSTVGQLVTQLGQ
jgi:NADH-quinone oxidoreductase subunit M